MLALITHLLAGKLTAMSIGKAIIGNASGLVASSMTTKILQAKGYGKLETMVASKTVGSLCSHSVERYLHPLHMSPKNHIIMETTVKKADIPLRMTSYDSPIIFGDWRNRRFYPLQYDDNIVSGNIFNDNIIDDNIVEGNIYSKNIYLL